MVYPNDYLIMKIKKQQMDEYLQQAEKDRMLLALEPHRRNPFGQLACYALHLLGHGLSAIGHRLDRFDVSNPSLPYQDTATHGVS